MEPGTKPEDAEAKADEQALDTEPSKDEATNDVEESNEQPEHQESEPGGDELTDSTEQPEAAPENDEPASAEQPQAATEPVPINPPIAEESDKQYVVAVILSYFLGTFGVDRFYLGYIGTGIIKLVTFGGFGIWYLIDLWQIGTGHFKDKAGKKLAGQDSAINVGSPVTKVIVIVTLLWNIGWTIFVVVMLAFGFVGGWQSTTRDIERQADVDAIALQLETYYTANGVYPSIEELNDSSWRQKNMSDLSNATLKDPAEDQKSDVKLVSSAQKNTYAYAALNVQGQPCMASEGCASYTITATLEGPDTTNKKGSLYVKKSVNSTRKQSGAVITATVPNATASKTRDVERQADIKAIQTQLEVYYANSGTYPTLAQMNDTAWVKQNMKGVDMAAFQDPLGSSTMLADKPAAKIYAYQPLNSADKPCTVAGDCQTFTLTATLENPINGSNLYVKVSLGN